jgi:hypothetical protein
MKLKKLSTRRKTGIALLFLLSGLATVLLFQISAGTGTITATRSTSSVEVGKTFTATITVDVDAPVTIAKAAVTYDRNALQLSNISYSGSPYNTEGPESSNNPGSLVINRYKLGAPYPSGKFTLATLTFVAKAAGNTSITLNKAGSLLYEESEQVPNILTQVNSTSIKITTPPPREPIPAPTNNTTNTNQQSTPPNRQNANSTTPAPSNQTQDSTPAAENNDQSDGVPALITNTGTPPTNLPAPGQSINGTSVSVGERALQMVRNIVPAMVLVGIAATIGWVIYKRSGHNSHFYGSKPAQTAGPGVVFDGSHTVKTNQDNNQQPPSPVQ